MISNKKICTNCISDSYLQTEIIKNTDVYKKCDFCGRISPTIDMVNLAARCESVITYFYKLSSLTDSVYPYDCKPEGENLVDLLTQLLSSPEKAISDLYMLLTEKWKYTNKWNNVDDPIFVKKTNVSDSLSSDWGKMEWSLKHQARHINPIVSSMLESVFGTILDDKTGKGDCVVVELGNGCNINTLYRARVFQTEEKLKTALSHPARHFGPPPFDICLAGRMNAKGVSVFYGATNREIAISEVRPPVGSNVVVVAFNLIRKLRLLDLHKLGSIMIDPTSSMFDPVTVKEVSRRDFLKTLTQKMVMPVMPDLQDHDYVITQAISDYLSTHPGFALDGILFPSAQNSLSSQDISSCNVVLFHKACSVSNYEKDLDNAIRFEEYEINDDGSDIIYAPKIIVDETKREEVLNDKWPYLPFFGKREPALDLDYDSISIYKVEGVRYKKSELKVEVEYRS